MPLKHATETLLVLVLGLALALTGLAIAILPPLPAGTLWWGLALILSLAYPLSLYPLLKSRRADYPFRALHFLPFVLLLLRFLLDLGSSFVGGLRTASDWYGWGWAAPAILVAFLLLMWFCIRVLRQRDTRLRMLAAVFLPFLFLGLFSEWTGWNDRIAGVLGGETLVASVPVTETGANLDPSADEAEERWRALLREREERRNALEGSGGGVAVTAGINGVNHAVTLAAASSSAASRPIALQPEVTPPRLTSSGPGMELAGLSMMGLYCGVLHVRARRRMRA